MGELYDKLKAYGESDIYPFHMPGHKRTMEADLSYMLDVTEVEGLDDLHDPSGILKGLHERIAKIYGADEAFLLLNGSTGGIHAAIFAATDGKSKILLARNSHKAAYNGVMLRNIEPVYVYPQTDPDMGIYLAVRPEDVENKLANDKDIRAVFITSPTYEGVVSDIGAIADIAHKYGAVLIVDAAHGAHLGFDERLPKNAVHCGADIVIMSLHKTLPAATQTAVMCVKKDLAQRVKKYFDVFMSSSPSYLLMCSIEKCVDFICGNKEEFNKYVDKVTELRNECAKLQKLFLYAPDKDYDFGKIVIGTFRCDLDGERLAKILRERYSIQVEMASKEYIIAMTSVCDTQEGFWRLINALKEIDAEINFCNKKKFDIPCEAEVFCRMADADTYDKEEILIHEARGRVSANFVSAYPPGVPVLAPGEIITDGTIKQICDNVTVGIKVYGVVDNKIVVCVTEGEKNV